MRKELPRASVRSSGAASPRASIVPSATMPSPAPQLPTPKWRSFGKLSSAAAAETKRGSGSG
eukprot:scaffold22678_cov65-Phaeocystis_antarctica.AAC.2